MNPVTIHLMRHGAPELTGRLLGRTDCAATAEGITACARVAKGLAVKTVVSSDLRRSIECAEATGLPLRVDARWRELDFGDWDGLAADQVDAAALERFYDDPDADPPPGGERWTALTTRVEKALREIHTPTLVVTHGGAMRAVLASVCGLGFNGSWAFDLPYAALLSLSVWPGETLRAQITGLRA